MGATQRDAAKAVGRSERTIRGWESDERWPLAKEEAADRWLGDLTDASRKAVLETVRSGNAEMALTILERVDERLAPAKQRVDLSGRVEQVRIREVVVSRPTANGASPNGGAPRNRLAKANGGG